MGFSWITTKLLAYVCGALLAIIVILGFRLSWAQAGEATAKAERALAIEQRDDAIEANASNLATIAAQSARLDEIKREAGQFAAQVTQAIADRNKVIAAQAQEIAELRKKRAGLYVQNPDAKAFGELKLPDALEQYARDNL